MHHLASFFFRQQVEEVFDLQVDEGIIEVFGAFQSLQVALAYGDGVLCVALYRILIVITHSFIICYVRSM
jgi:hypothetical protein